MAFRVSSEDIWPRYFAREVVDCMAAAGVLAAQAIACDWLGVGVAFVAKELRRRRAMARIREAIL
ncbi:MAG: hypothetical protein U0176_00180 [Bacteroidia bacterium]